MANLVRALPSMARQRHWHNSLLSYQLHHSRVRTRAMRLRDESQSTVRHCPLLLHAILIPGLRMCF
jgi:hypothetical protein